MKKQKFAEEMAKYVSEATCGQYSMEVRDVEKTNSCYTGLVIHKEGSQVTPVVRLDDLYKKYSAGDSISKIFDALNLDGLYAEAPDIDADGMYDYEKMKNRLFIKIVNADANRRITKGSPHENICDLAMLYYISFDDATGTVSRSALVNNSLLDAWGIDQKQLHDDALKNTEKMYKARVGGLFSVLKEMGAVDDEDAPLSDPLIVVRNNTNLFGAAALFYDGMMERLGNRIHGDYFILPSSIHEVLILKDDGTYKVDELVAMVQQINKTGVAEEDRLSDHVYHYSRETMKFEIAA